MKTILLAIILTTSTFAQTTQQQSQFDKTAEWHRQQAQQREVQRQRQAIQQLQAEQQRAKRAADRAAADADAIFVPLRPTAPTAPAPPRITPTPQDRIYINRQLRRIQANPGLTQAQKTRLANQILNAIEP